MSTTKDKNIELLEELNDSFIPELWIEESKDELSPEELKQFAEQLRSINQTKELSEQLKGIPRDAVINFKASSITNDEYIKEFKRSWFPTGELIEGLILKDLLLLNNQEFGNMYPSLDWWLKNKTRKVVFLNLVISRAQIEDMTREKDMPGIASIFIYFNSHTTHKIGGLTSVEDFQKYKFVSRQSIQEEIKKGAEQGHIKRWKGFKDNRKNAYSLSEDSWIEFRRLIHDLINLDKDGQEFRYVDEVLDSVKGISEKDKKELKDMLLGMRFISRVNLFFSP